MKNPDVQSSSSIVVITDHARRRGQARGITLRSAELATLYGEKSRVRGWAFPKTAYKITYESG